MYNHNDLKRPLVLLPMKYLEEVRSAPQTKLSLPAHINKVSYFMQIYKSKESWLMIFLEIIRLPHRWSSVRRGSTTYSQARPESSTEQSHPAYAGAVHHSLSKRHAGMLCMDRSKNLCNNHADIRAHVGTSDGGRGIMRRRMAAEVP